MFVLCAAGAAALPWTVDRSTSTPAPPSTTSTSAPPATVRAQSSPPPTRRLGPPGSGWRLNRSGYCFRTTPGEDLSAIAHRDASCEVGP